MNFSRFFRLTFCFIYTFYFPNKQTEESLMHVSIVIRINWKSVMFLCAYFNLFHVLFVLSFYILNGAIIYKVSVYNCVLHCYSGSIIL